MSQEGQSSYSNENLIENNLYLFEVSVNCKIAKSEVSLLVEKLAKLKIEDIKLQFNELLRGNINLVATTQSGSKLLQNLIINCNCNDLVNSIFCEVEPDLLNLLKQTYANYFCQTLILHLNETSKKVALWLIIQNMHVILKNMISFKALLSILEFQIDIELQDRVLEIVSQVENYLLLTQSRYLKLVEVLVSYMDDTRMRKVLRIITPIFRDLIKVKHGYFLLRKLVMHIDDELTKSEFLRLISTNSISQILSSNNGCLLAQSMIKRFEEGIMPTQNLIGKIAVDSTTNNSFHPEENNCGYINIDKKLYPNEHIGCSAALITFFDIISDDLVLMYSSFEFKKPIARLHKKIYLSLLHWPFLKRRITFKLISIKSIATLSSVLTSILLLFQGLFLINSVLAEASSIGLDTMKLTRELTSLKLRGLPADLLKKWVDFSSNLKKNQLKLNEFSAFESKLIVNVEKGKKDILDDVNEDKVCQSASIDYGSECFKDFIDNNQSFFESNSKRIINPSVTGKVSDINKKAQPNYSLKRYEKPHPYCMLNSNDIVANNILYSKSEQKSTRRIFSGVESNVNFNYFSTHGELLVKPYNLEFSQGISYSMFHNPHQINPNQHLKGCSTNIKQNKYFPNK